jgi:hypothetical protein
MYRWYCLDEARWAEASDQVAFFGGTFLRSAPAIPDWHTTFDEPIDIWLPWLGMENIDNAAYPPNRTKIGDRRGGDFVDPFTRQTCLFQGLAPRWTFVLCTDA